MILKAPAKINIGLKIINKREDGYHNLETIFYPVRLFDEIYFKINPSNRNTNSVIIKSSSKVIPSDRSNICYKTVEAFFRTFLIRDYYTIEIDVVKNIPVGGGLGGGSSDAAALLKFLIKFFNVNISEKRKEIMQTALAVGSDVPFFLILKPCFAQGRGEIISKLDSFNLDNYNILLVNPNLHVSTKWAFENLNFQQGVNYPSGLKDVKEFRPDLFGLLQNDFENVVFSRYKELENIKNELKKFGAVYSSMSGSGATMFGIFGKNDSELAKKACQFYKSKKYFAFIS